MVSEARALERGQSARLRVLRRGVERSALVSDRNEATARVAGEPRRSQTVGQTWTPDSIHLSRAAGLRAAQAWRGGMLSCARWQAETEAMRARPNKALNQEDTCVLNYVPIRAVYAVDLKLI